MSRIGQRPVAVPSGVTITIGSGQMAIKGPKGEVKVPLHPMVKVTNVDNQIKVEKASNAREARAMWGTTQSLIQGAVSDVVNSFTKKLELHGVGYRANLQGRNLVLNLGYSHDVIYPVPEGVDIKVEGNALLISGCNRQKVGQTAAEIRKYRKPEPYKGKGIRHVDGPNAKGEYLNSKEGKKK